jgi:hypothetical protein
MGVPRFKRRRRCGEETVIIAQKAKNRLTKKLILSAYTVSKNTEQPVY